ncbi:MAG: class I SAM-dependent methyltransferase, partial [Anaerolineales bacterium]
RELVESVLSITRIPSTGRILEIGSGTGKATRLFAEKGFEIYCIEPGENLNRVAIRSLKGINRVTIEQVRFEEWNGETDPFDLAISAQAFHWINPDIGYRKAASALKANGHIALFWNMHAGFKGNLESEIERVYRQHAPKLAQRREKTEEVIKQREAALSSSGYFTGVTVNRFYWSERYGRRQYIGLLNTYSDHIGLPERARRNLMEGISEVISQNGGYINKPYITVLYVGKKAA